MIGTSHVDPNGRKNLLRLLRKIKPERIMIEEAKAHFADQELFTEILREELTQRSVDPVLAELLLTEQEVRGYEMRAARQYCESRGLPEPLSLEDYESDTEQNLRLSAVGRIITITSQFTPETATTYAREMTSNAERFYHTLKKFLGEYNEVNAWMWIRTDDNCERDRAMERKLRDTLEEDKRTVTITGLKHILAHPLRQSLYSRIREFNPRRYAL